MGERPSIGRAGGQQYPVLRSIRTFLQQMVEGGACPAPTVIKELLQNADDAGATELAVILDERQLSDELRAQAGLYADLLGPALLVRNNAPFHICQSCRDGNRTCECDRRDDFHAICDVAASHKRAQATAAGRFGIGFNSVYLLTDTPLVFSRREVHVFDLLHRMFGETENGWQFSLDDFPHGAGEAGVIKSIFERCFPKVALQNNRSFAELANDASGDYQQAIFRLPLRQSDAGSPAIYDERFRTWDARIRLVEEMAAEAARSILFLKHITRVSFSLLRDGKPEPYTVIETDPRPRAFAEFLENVARASRGEGPQQRYECDYPCRIHVRNWSEGSQHAELARVFHIWQRACFGDSDLQRLRIRLQKNGERAVPWVAIAVPLNVDSCELDGKGSAAWRVFLPLLEEGPSRCLFNACFFVGPSRQHIVFGQSDSDEGSRRTEWNRALIKGVLVPLLQDLTLDLPERARDLLQQDPNAYLSLFPSIAKSTPVEADETPAGCFAQAFGNGDWRLRLPDLWGACIDLLAKDQSCPMQIELIPEWLARYQDRFRGLSSDKRRFFPWRLGNALAARIDQSGPIAIAREPAADVIRSILCNDAPPDPKDLTKLVRAAGKPAEGVKYWEGAWGLIDSDGSLVRYADDYLYVLDDSSASGAVRRLRAMRLPFERVVWVRPDAGLAALDGELRPDNICPPTQPTVLKMLCRLPSDNRHDQVESAHDISEVVDLLVKAGAAIPPDARLGFLIRTAHNKHDRRKRGVILLRPDPPVDEDQALWEVWFRGLFAEVDPAFRSEVNRLLQANGRVLDLLHSSDCRVVHGTMSEALAILHTARRHDEGLLALLEQQINQPAHTKWAELISARLLEITEGKWERMPDDERYTVAALPIHRRSDGAFIPLLHGAQGELSALPQRFRLQSEDDLTDAPVTLPECQLLHTPNAPARRFYRRWLGLQYHGRVAVLKEVLAQIGTHDGAANLKMLEYLTHHHQQEVQRLQCSHDPNDRDDAAALQQALAAARTVPCIDERWRAAGECKSGWQLQAHLVQQGWPAQRLARLIACICHEEHIASLDQRYRKLIRRLHDLPEVEPGELAARAISSESPDLTLKERAKLILDNYPSQGLATRERARVLAKLELPVVQGRAPLELCEDVDEDMTDLPMAVRREVMPTAIDRDLFAKGVGISEDSVEKVLRALRIPTITRQELHKRLLGGLHALWRSLEQDARLDLLAYIGRYALHTQAKKSVQSLDVVLSQASTWVAPDMVVAPALAATQPPYLSDVMPLLDKLPEEKRADICDVWNAWCGKQSFADVLSLVLKQVEAESDPEHGCRAAYRWLEKVVGASDLREYRDVLGKQKWVLARKGNERRLCAPNEVLVHCAQELLSSHYWVPALELPQFAKQQAEALGFITTLKPSQLTLESLADCLATRVQPVDWSQAIAAYKLVIQFLDEEQGLQQQWQQLAQSKPVYRTAGPNPQNCTALQLFLGTKRHNRDLSSHLRCLAAASDVPRQIPRLYERLGVPRTPTVAQLLAALSDFGKDPGDDHKTHGLLVQCLLNASSETSAQLEGEKIGKLSVRTCGGTYEPLCQCYYDQDFGRKNCIVRNEHACRLIDAEDEPTTNLLTWVRQRHPELVKQLRTRATARVTQLEKCEGDPGVTHRLAPWKLWTRELMRQESSVYHELGRLKLVPKHAIEIVPASRVCVSFDLGAEGRIDQSPDWRGPKVISAGTSCIIVQPDLFEDTTTLDRAIARELARLLRDSAIEPPDEAIDAIIHTLERPSTVLEQLGKTNRRHVLYQYHDQVADPQFAELWDAYRRSVPGSEEAAKLEERMHGLLKNSFLSARQKQIRDYGYDERSVFAELLQNAEDAYMQRLQLGMDQPDPCYVKIRYTEEPSGRALDIEHRGRPFNYWQHGTRQEPTFQRDVEGVLRSAGSFKPHTHLGTEKDVHSEAIGRFGLGFKSVYLLTDRPEIHSEAWHFAIDVGCLPEEVAAPSDLPEGVTRFHLPLRPDVRLDHEQLVKRFRNLLPFLTSITRLELHWSGKPPVVFSVSVRKVADALGADSEGSVEHVTISVEGEGALGQAPLTFLRCRSRGHAGQLGLLLAPDGTPRRWEEVFDDDFYAVLPLRARLRCGVGVSHRFDVQSGRTHLVDAQRNQDRAAEIAELLRFAVEGLWADRPPTLSVCTILARFWELWRWDAGDGECAPLRVELARALVKLAKCARVVPTYAADTAVNLADQDGPRVYFAELPERFRQSLIEGAVAIEFSGGQKVALSASRVVQEAFARAYRRACQCAEEPPVSGLRRVGWEEIAQTFNSRAWFAEKPELLNAIAECLNEDQARSVATWLRECRVRGRDGAGQIVHELPNKLLAPTFPGGEHIPQRFGYRLSEDYGERARKLLADAGLHKEPTVEHVRQWLLDADLSTEEAVKIVGYLREDSRYRSLWELRRLFRSEWFPGRNGRITIKKAVELQYIPSELLNDEVFKCWLGLVAHMEVEPPPPSTHHRREPSQVLNELHDWWQENKERWLCDYERRLYPGGQLPALRAHFSEKELTDRKNWLTLFLLASFQKIGRAQPEQHRKFLERCEQRGWLDVFADRTQDAQRWMDILDEFLDDPFDQRYYQWMKWFVEIFQLSRWLGEYVEAFLNVNQLSRNVSLDAILAPRTSALFSGGGPDGPALTRTLGIGACFVMRELTRKDVIRQPHLHAYCYVPSQSVLSVLEKLGCNMRSAPPPDQSQQIYRFLEQHLGPERATFGRTFDLPLLALAGDPRLQQDLLKGELVDFSDELGE